MFGVIARSARQPTLRAVRYASQVPKKPVAPEASSSQAPKETPAPATETEPIAPVEDAPIPISSLPSLDFSPESHERRTGARSSKDSMSSSERKRQFAGRIAAAAIVAGLGVQGYMLGREWEEDELKEKKLTLEDAPSGRFGRTQARFTDLFDIFHKPAWPELLPPPLPAPHQKPMTLLLSIDDLLITSTWDRQHGWRTAKRPGVDYFLAYLSQFYEIVIFTTQQHYTAMPTIEKLDPYNFFIPYKLFRDATSLVDGKIVKDLTSLNRDLSKVVQVDTDPDHVRTHPENALILPKWKGDPADRGLIAIIPFLESIGIYKPQDVRPIIKAYQGKNIPLEYAKKEFEAKQKHIEEWKSGKGPKQMTGFTLSGLFGGSGAPPPSSPIPLTYLEQKRREAQLQYKEEQAYIASHKEEFERLLEEDRQAMAKEMSGSLWGALDAMSAKGAEAADKAADKTTQGK